MKTYSVKLKHTKEGLFIDGNLCQVRKGKTVTVIENNSAGVGHSAYANISSSGSVEGMKNLGYWRKEDKTVKQGDFIYNLSSVVISCSIDALALFIENGGELPTLSIDEWKETIFNFSI